MPTKLEVNRGLAPTPLAHMEELKPYIDFRLSRLLAAKSIIGTPLAEVPPLTITDSTAIHAKSFKEIWNPQHCFTSLASVEIYEAPNNPWQLNCTCPSFQGAEIAGVGCSWAQHEEGVSTWRNSQFDASAADASKKTLGLSFVYPDWRGQLGHRREKCEGGVLHIHGPSYARGPRHSLELVFACR